MRSAGLKGRVVSTLIVCTHMAILCRGVVTVANLIIVLLWYLTRHIPGVIVLLLVCLVHGKAILVLNFHLTMKVRGVVAFFSIRYNNTNNKNFLVEEHIFFGTYYYSLPLAIPDTNSDYYILPTNVSIDICKTFLTTCSENNVILKKI